MNFKNLTEEMIVEAFESAGFELVKIEENALVKDLCGFSVDEIFEDNLIKGTLDNKKYFKEYKKARFFNDLSPLAC